MKTYPPIQTYESWNEDLRIEFGADSLTLFRHLVQAQEIAVKLNFDLLAKKLQEDIDNVRTDITIKDAVRHYRRIGDYFYDKDIPF